MKRTYIKLTLYLNAELYGRAFARCKKLAAQWGAQCNFSNLVCEAMEAKLKKAKA